MGFLVGEVDKKSRHGLWSQIKSSNQFFRLTVYNTDWEGKAESPRFINKFCQLQYRVVVKGKQY